MPDRSSIAHLLREYETVFIMRPDATEEMTARVRERIDSVSERLGGHIINYDDWGKRKLAYEIRDRTAQRRLQKGLYVYMRYLGGNDLVPELERNFRLLEPVLRYMTIKLDEDVIASERLAQEAQSEEG
ncbi:MAG: 30S ribosomal protein S6 [Myxococcales bacterium]|nr:30S ribosomal protein S6 [Myxococcales bacterium]